MSLLGGIASARTRMLANVLDVGRPNAGTWKHLLADLGDIGANARPVVIQGGLSTDAYLYEPLRLLLTERAFTATATKMPLHGFGSLQQDAAALGRAVSKASRQSLANGGDGLVDVVAHSKGGPSARWYLQKMGGDAKVSQLVTAGSPHRGMMPFGRRYQAISQHLPGIEGVKQLSAAAPEMAALNDDFAGFMARARAANPDFRITSIAGDLDLPGLRKTDGLVPVAATQLDDTIAGVRNITYRGNGPHHGAIVGQGGMHEPTLRGIAELLARRV